MVYYRGISYLRLIKWFRHLIDMIIGVSINSLSLIVIVIYVVLTFTIMFYKSIGVNSYLTFLKHSWFSIQGELNNYNDALVQTNVSVSILSWFIYTLMVLFIPLILMNFLIAKMSNKYTELENLEKITSYREKAKLIMEIELFYSYSNKDRYSKYFTFIAKESSNLEDSEELFANKVEDNIDNIHESINEIGKRQEETINFTHEKQNELEQMLNEILNENKFLKSQMLALKTENNELKTLLTSKKELIDEKINNLNQKVLMLNQIADEIDNTKERKMEKIGSIRDLKSRK